MIDHHPRSALSRWLALGCVAACLGAIPARAEEDALSGREVRRAVKAAEEALAGGDLAGAASAYGPLLAALPAGDERRVEALWVMALSLSGRSAADDVVRARALLAELVSTHPGHRRAVDAASAAAWLAALETSREDAERLRRELQAEREARGEEARRLAAGASTTAEELAASRAEADALRREVARLQGALATAREELTRKSEALEQVKATLVGQVD